MKSAIVLGYARYSHTQSVHVRKKTRKKKPLGGYVLRSVRTSGFRYATGNKRPKIRDGNAIRKRWKVEL